MTKISIAFLAALSLAGFGCHKDKAKDKANAAIAKLTEIKNKMCACPDKACSEKVSAELTDWDQAQENAAGGKPAVSEEDDKKMEDIKEEMSECLLKLEFPGRNGAAGSAGAAGAAGGSGGTTGSGTPAGGAADGSAAGAAPAGNSAGSSASGSAAAGSAH